MDYFVAKDSERFLDALVEKYGIEFQLSAGLRRRISLIASVDGKKTAQALKEKEIEIPKYLEEIVFSGKTSMNLPQGRLYIFDADDCNVGGDVPSLLKKLSLPIAYLLGKWDFSQFEKSEEIKKKLELSRETKPMELYESKFVDYNTKLANESFAMMDTKGIVKNLFGDPEWRGHAISYGPTLLNAVIKKIEIEKAKGVKENIELIDKLTLLLLDYQNVLMKNKR